MKRIGGSFSFCGRAGRRAGEGRGAQFFLKRFDGGLQVGEATLQGVVVVALPADFDDGPDRQYDEDGEKIKTQQTQECFHSEDGEARSYFVTDVWTDGKAALR